MAVNGFGLNSPASASARPPGKAPAQLPPEGGEAPASAEGGKKDGGDSEYPQGVSSMLKEVHGLLQKQGGKGLPGFSVSGPTQSGNSSGSVQA